MNKQRSRGRNNNQRRGGGGNPLSRSYESNGPDVKVRGNAAHIAEKYTQLARDAAASGDNVMAENYLQHAEHYNRIILAAQAQVQPRQDQQADTANDEDGGEEPVRAEAKSEPAEASSRPGEEGDEDAKPRRAVRQRRPRREKTDEGETAAQPAADGAGEAEPAASATEQAAGDEEKPKRAVRRTTRRAPKKAEAEAAGELPAFLTAGRETAAE